MPDSPSDNEQWERLAAIFAELLESEDPEAALAGIVDPELRAEAEKLWRNHESAARDGFLHETPGVTVLPVFLPGQLLCGRFRVERMLGAGGMGEVYLAADEKVGGRVALKAMARMLAPVESMRHRFLAEVQTARRVTHRNICRIHDWFEDGETAFFTMEYLEGQTLDSLLSERTPSAIEARDWLLGIAEGLRAAHGGGILHGDLKPGNVMITAGPNPRAVVMDFGLARVLEEEAAASGDRNYSLRGGTAEYMAPEVAAGGPPSIASDLFAFGRIGAKLAPEARWWKAYVQASPEARPKTLEPAVRALSPGLTRRYLAIGGLMAGSAAAARWVFGGGEGADPLLAGGTVLVNGIRADEELTSAARAIRMLFVLALRQSPRLRSPADQDLLPVLRGLRKDARLPAEGEVLAQLAERMRASHWVESTLRRGSGRFDWELAVRRKSDGVEVLKTTVNQASVAAVAESAAEWIRRAAGESETSLRKNPSGAANYTTKVPEALARYAEALEHIAVTDLDSAMPLLKDAVRLDPEFAQAHATIGTCLNNYRRWVESVESLETAMRLAARLPEQEKSWIATAYYRMVEDQVHMVEEAHKGVGWYPEEAKRHRYLGSVLCSVGRAEAGVASSRRAVELSPFELVNWAELITGLCEANRFEEALLAADESKSRAQIDHPFYRGRGLAYLGLGDSANALKCFEQPGIEGRVLNGARLLCGRMESALVGLERDRIEMRNAGRAIEEHELGGFLAAAYYLTDRPALGRMALARLPESEASPQHCRWLQAAVFWAGRLRDEGALKRAAEVLDAIARRWPNGYTKGMAKYAEAVRARMTEDPKAAESLILETLGTSFSVLGLAEAAEIFEDCGKLDAADEHWQQFENRKGTILKTHFPGAVLYGWRQRMRLARRRNDDVQLKRCADLILSHWGTGMADSSLVQEARLLGRGFQLKGEKKS